MKTKILFIITTILSASTIFAQSNTEDEGVIINGVKWATRNVDMPGTFAETPESAGELYQWNRKVPWNTTDKEVEGWDNTIGKSAIWIAKNDPSPEGWRVPAREEIFSLFYSENVTNEWITQNGVHGMLCTDISSGNSIFLPSAPSRSSSNGVLLDGYEEGHYWANDVTTYFDEYKAYGMLIGNDGEKEWSSTDPRFAHSVRSVAQDQDVVPRVYIITEDNK